MINFFKQYWAQYCILNIYIVGLIGFLIPSIQQNWAYLTSFSLITSLGIICFLHEPKSKKFFLTLLLVGILGFILEVIGVKTGKLFGVYSYGKKLGPMLLEVPIMLAINWALLLYLTQFLAQKITTNIIAIAIIGALLMVGIDFLIEPFAIYFGLWQWENIHVPTQNYLMWFMASFVLHLILRFNNQKIQNPIAFFLFVTMILFFLFVDLLVIWF